jgi:hypothetical protein
VQARYREGRRMKVRWFSGAQPYDAILWSSRGWLSMAKLPERFSLRSQRLFIKTITSRVDCSTSGVGRSA